MTIPDGLSMKCFKYGLLILLMKAGGCLAAQQLIPSPAQIEQFKSLSAEEKQALALGGHRPCEHEHQQCPAADS